MHLQDVLQSLWLHAAPGRLCALQQLKAVGLRDAMQALGGCRLLTAHPLRLPAGPLARSSVEQPAGHRLTNLQVIL